MLSGPANKTHRKRNIGCCQLFLSLKKVSDSTHHQKIKKISADFFFLLRGRGLLLQFPINTPKIFLFEHLVGFFEIKIIGIEFPSQPLHSVLIFTMPGIIQNFKHLIIPPDSAAILGRTVSLTLDAYRKFQRSIGMKNFFEANLMFLTLA